MTDEERQSLDRKIIALCLIGLGFALGLAIAYVKYRTNLFPRHRCTALIQVPACGTGAITPPVRQAGS
jgi:hypothetical protein